MIALSETTDATGAPDPFAGLLVHSIVFPIAFSAIITIRDNMSEMKSLILKSFIKRFDSKTVQRLMKSF